MQDSVSVPALALTNAFALPFALALAFAVALVFALVLAFAVAFLSVIPEGNLLFGPLPLKPPAPCPILKRALCA